MFKRILLLLLLSFFLFQTYINAKEIKGPHLKFNGSDISVSFEFAIAPDILNEIRGGITKEIIFYIDLFRSWEIWPDEFIIGKKIIRTIRSDPMKKEYIASSFDGETLLQKRFNSFQSMISWVFTFDGLFLTSMKDRETDKYFVKVTAEARYKKIPSLISEIFFFLPSREFKVTKDSEPFTWDKTRSHISK